MLLDFGGTVFASLRYELYVTTGQRSDGHTINGTIVHDNAMIDNCG
jgi:hypothetical protein